MKRFGAYWIAAALLCLMPDGTARAADRAWGGNRNAEERRAGTSMAETNREEARPPKLVILKLDDVVGGSGGEAMPARWQRVADYLEGKRIKAAFGIIGYSLVKENPAYFKWITDRAARGYVEFWNHGFWQRSGSDTSGEFERGYDEQLRALHLTDSLALARLGLELTAWGPHWSGTNEDTDRALSHTPRIRMTFGYPPEAVHYKGIVLPRNIDLEYPTHNPDFGAFLEAYRGKWKDLDYFFLQGHPNSWDDTRWENFVKVIEFLESEGVKFVTPTELYEILQKK